MKEEIQTILDKIYLSLKTHDYYQPSLLDGEAGYCLFDQFYISYTGIDAVNHADNVEDFENNLQTLSEDSIGCPSPFFSSGKAGVNWFFSYLKAKDVLDEENWEILCDDDPELFEQAILYLKDGNYDFLHGSIGIAYHSLYAQTNQYTTFQETFFQLLYKLAYQSPDKMFIAHFDLTNLVPVPNKINLGMAHGLISVLKFCLQCYQKNICSVAAKKLALDIADLFRSTINRNTNNSLFPNILMLDEPAKGYSRVGWCYGDLSIGFVLYQAGVVFEDTALKDLGTEILIHTSKRRSEEQTMVRDAGICHGSAGIAHVYNKMWHYTKNPVFKEACDFWIQQTLDFSIHPDGYAGFKSYSPDASGKYTNSYGLLNGISGIGLVLLSYLTGDFSWDYCIMLND
ncbi:lantibiotic modifying enzyme [Pedobacter cryoconitis]|uniref:Lantibiotic modifying enzyme n=1 Tax=Pedobacter cryoconitis TaxID=188932 RepID=A0A7W8YU31_9SPHI|nr:lanthionine synthetase LanC family protein [Pedobacter cryoconitis]MBB5621809.1 lantibiotic modifying enzyme [Pedobacter cryoconitis]